MRALGTFRSDLEYGLRLRRAGYSLYADGDAWRQARVSTVSVVIPCYNYASYLPECVGSVLAQPGVDVEVLIIDDASPDDTPAVAVELGAGDPRVNVRRHAANQGHIATFNEGLAWATDNYTVVISADDMLAPGGLGRAVALLDTRPDIGFVYGGESALRPEPHQVGPHHDRSP